MQRTVRRPIIDRAVQNILFFKHLFITNIRMFTCSVFMVCLTNSHTRDNLIAFFKKKLHVIFYTTQLLKGVL